MCTYDVCTFVVPAAEDAKGRVLLVAMTNLDVRRPIIWNITKIAKIAASGHPRALELIRRTR